MTNQHKEEKDVVFAVFLIFIGTVFLLNTTGFVSWGIWVYLFRFWPVFLILGGIQIIFGKSLITNIILGIISLALFTLIGISSYISYTEKSVPFVPDDINRFFLEEKYTPLESDLNQVEEEIIVAGSEFETINTRNVDITIGASSALITDNSESNDYLTLNSKYTENHIEPKVDSEKKDNTLDLTFTTEFKERWFFFNNSRTKFDFEIGKTDLDTNLQLVIGAGEADIELNDLSTKNIDCEIGAGELSLSLTKDSLPEELSVDVGAGQFNLDLPEEVGYTLNYEVGVGDIKIDNEKVTESLAETDTYKSENYDTAESKIDINTTVGVGTFKININN